MQAIILTHTEPAELCQLSVKNSCCSLPFGSSTVLENLLHRFMDSDISDILITHKESQTTYFEQLTAMYRECLPPHVYIKLVVMPSGCSMTELFSRIRSHITMDYVFLTYSTTVLTDLDLRSVFLSLIRNNAAVTAVFCGLPCSESKHFKALPREVVLTSRSGTQLLGHYSPADIKKQTSIPRSLTSQGAAFLARTDLRDLRFYLLTKSTIQAFIRLREDFPHKKKTIWQLIDLISVDANGTTHTASDSPEENMDRISDQVDAFYRCNKKSSGTCMYEHKTQRISIQLNDPLSFVEANRIYLQKCHADGTTALATKKGCPSDFSQISEDCAIDPKALITGSKICSGCTVETNTRIINSLLLNGVTVKQGCIIQGCVLGDQVTTESDCHLKSCAVAALQRVPAGTVLESEQLGFTDPELEVTQA